MTALALSVLPFICLQFLVKYVLCASKIRVIEKAFLFLQRLDKSPNSY